MPHARTGEFKTNPEQIAGRIERYFKASGFKLQNLMNDGATVTLPNGEVDTVAHDMENVLGVIGEGVSAEDSVDTAFALGIVLGMSCKHARSVAGDALPREYQLLAVRTAERSLADTPMIELINQEA